MLRRPLIAGNWKMNGLKAEGLALVDRLLALRGRGPTPFDLLICPPATLLDPIASRLAGSPVQLGAQDCHVGVAGAHTGDLSATMLKDAGAGHIIVGHSERRANHHESDDLIRQKAEAALAAGLTAILCVGETEAERASGQTMAVVDRQLRGSWPATGPAARMVLAYEPVWAIGSGRVPSLADVQEVHEGLRQAVSTVIGDAAVPLRILYGGSMKPANARDLLALPDVDGGLIGGASLDAQSFWAIALASPGAHA